MLSARSILLLATCASACTTTEAGNLGADQPRVQEDVDASEPEPVESLSEAEAPAARDAGRDALVAAPVEARDAGARDASPPIVGAPVDAGVELCMQYGPRPGDHWPLDDRDGGLPSLFDNDRLPPPGAGLLPFEFEAGAPPFCCTLMTPWFCAPPTPALGP